MLGAARVIAEGGGLLARRAHRRRGRGRRARQPRRRGARRALARERGRGDRADRSRRRRRAQGLSVGRGRDARPRRARQPSRGRARRDPAHGPRAPPARGASTGSCRHSLPTRCSARRRCTRRSSMAGPSGAAIPTAAASRSSAGRCRGRRMTSRCRKCAAILERLRRDGWEFDGEARPVFGRGAYEIDPSHPLPAMLVGAADDGRLSAAPRRDDVLERRRHSWRAPGFRRCCSVPAAQASQSRANTCVWTTCGDAGMRWSCWCGSSCGDNETGFGFRAALPKTKPGSDTSDRVAQEALRDAALADERQADDVARRLRCSTRAGTPFTSHPGVSYPHEVHCSEIRPCSKCSSASWP